MIDCTSEEEDAVRAICKLAEALERLLYSFDEGYLSNRGKAILSQEFRPLKNAVDHYYGEESPLVWNPAPGKPFTKQPKEVRTNG